MKPHGDGSAAPTNELPKSKHQFVNGVLNLYATIFGRPIFRNLNYLVLQLGLRGIGVLNYKTPYLSGEDAVARRLIKALESSGGMVLDIGANEGDFTELIVKASDKLRVVSFEPHPITYSRLQRRFAGNERVELVNCAVGREEGTIDLFDYEQVDGTEHASVFRDVIERTHEATARKHTVKLVALDALNLKGDVGLIKIDVEGFELAVLQGARSVIATKRPKYLLVEFNEMNTISRTFLQDIFDELKGYKAERVLPGGKTLQLNHPYRPWHHEIFAYQNLLFTRTS